MKILSASQIKRADKYTIKYEPIPSISLMERASQAFVNKFKELYPIKSEVKIFCGIGNNGGDGLAVARLLRAEFYKVQIYVVGEIAKGTKDFMINLRKAESTFSINSLFLEMQTIRDFPEIRKEDIVIDAIFGSGLSRVVSGLQADVIEYLNQSDAQRVALDIASGLGADEKFGGCIFKPHYTITFQSPKLSFFFSQNHEYVGEWFVVNIGLLKTFLDSEYSSYFFTNSTDVKNLVPKRSKFDYKNKVGRVAIVAGSIGKIGAAVLCAKSAFRSGAGIMEVHTPKCGGVVLQTTLPETMVSVDEGEDYITSIPLFDGEIAVGPGIGQNEQTVKALKNLLGHSKTPLVLDADAINIIAAEPELLKVVPPESILTPHEGEFRRLVGAWDNEIDKLEKLIDLCKKYRINAVLKGPNSAVCNSAGIIHFNSTGNPILATAGSGDVLTGVIIAFLSQGLAPFQALKLGVYIHGLAGDILVTEMQYGAIASDIIEKIPHAIKKLVD